MYATSERNARIFTSVSTPLPVLRAATDRLIRDRLRSSPARSPSVPSLLLLYFDSYQPP
ncbi:BnaA09g07430D [Brassica napus]|uniref:BnaA09g07430D protein n=2 Tax=Brassica TaxID=3705 RepID=A0A078G0X8_BRANA|nr:BnaA09g07430D [Brassica napus]